jgi:hypothetical protein
MSTEFYRRVPIRYLQIKECGNIEEYKECSICYEEFGAHEYVALLPCYHIFHEQCIKRHINLLFRNKIRHAIQLNHFPALINYDFSVCPYRCDSVGEQRRCIKNKANVPMRLLPYKSIQINSADIDVERFEYWSLPWIIARTDLKHNLLMVLSHCRITYECDFIDRNTMSPALSPREIFLPLTITEGRLGFLYAGKINEDVSVCDDKHECTEALLQLPRLYTILNRHHTAYVTFNNKIYKIEEHDPNAPSSVPWYQNVLGYLWGSGKRKRTAHKRVQKRKSREIK